MGPSPTPSKPETSLKSPQLFQLMAMSAKGKKLQASSEQASASVQRGTKTVMKILELSQL